ncbi:MAG: helix-turn-helix domain-containing protein, partial [Actinomadura sp.]
PRSPWERLLEQFAKARATRLPLLLRGERGTGKTTLARRLHDQGIPYTVLDAAAACGTRPGNWLGRLDAALAGTVVLQHLDALDPALAARTASLPVSPQVRLVATAAHRTVSAGPLAALVERFPVVLDVPPVRERTADIPALVTELIEELRPRPPRPRCTAEALAALAAHEWPGNIRQLRQVVTTALVRSMSCDITLDDLPGEYAGRHLTKLERAERAALLTALRDAAWDREAAARDLGISRATIYRKLKRFGIRPPTGHMQEDIG